jgi:predicted GH43/DUF377 family glycosyl hydrolase
VSCFVSIPTVSPQVIGGNREKLSKFQFIEDSPITPLNREFLRGFKGVGRHTLKDNFINDSNDASHLVIRRSLVIEPEPGSPWASEMVLNPGLLQDPSSGRWHMLFRATGPFSQNSIPGEPDPYPIFLGYASSADRESWDIDFTRPALAPKLAREIKDITIEDDEGRQVTNFANGCVEDPRMFFLDGECYLTAACRMFPPGPYWIHDDPTQCAPLWSKGGAHTLGFAASENVTVNVLFKVNLPNLAARKYDAAFQYITHLTDPLKGENRDVILFPEKLDCCRGLEYVQIHRPWNPALYENIKGQYPPSMVICSAPSLKALAIEESSQTILARPAFSWDRERIGASGPLVKLGEGEWLLSYHGKENREAGYTQSFMILKHTAGSLPVVAHRSAARVFYPREPWEMPGRFVSPVIFITGMVVTGELLVLAYGAADERVGIAELKLADVLAHVRKFDDAGHLL